MKYFEFGKETDPLAVILHGGGTSYKGAEPAARMLANRFHVVLAAYDGFNPSEPDTEFTSVMDEAQRVSDYIVDHYQGKIDVLYGISFGCRILMEVLKDERLQIQAAIADGMSLRNYPDIKSKAGKDIYCFFFTGLFYAIMAHPGPLRKRFLAKVTGRSLSEVDRVLYTKDTWKSWKNQDYWLIGKRTDYSLFERTHMFLWYGIKGTVDKKLSDNLDRLKDTGYPFELKIFSEFGHGGLAGEHPVQFVKEVTDTWQKSFALR